MVKYIFVTGGVVSSLGKGISSSSLGKLLESRGIRVTVMKCDPYLNVDPGTMNPYQHGEVYVTDDGAETDLDLGHYERFLSTPINQTNNITAGKIYHSVIQKERHGVYLGATVQVIPHITDEIKRALSNVAKNRDYDVVICEIGGTVGDIESLPFLEAIRQFRRDIGRENAINIHVTLVPYIHTASELKTKPTQHSVGKLREIGIETDIVLCRSERHLSRELRAKIALFCNIYPDQVIQCLDVDDIYKVPIHLQEEGLDSLVIKMLGIKGAGNSNLDHWKKNVVYKLENPKHEVKIAVAGKYTELQDAYKSIYEALKHGGIANETKVKVIKIDSELLTSSVDELKDYDVDGILIPGGFGDRGVQGKLNAIQFARENKIPFFGICLGMQCAVIEFARNVCKLKRANSTEFEKKTPHPIISMLIEQRKIKDLGGTMRLGSYPCELKKGSLAQKVYGKTKIHERHRHRYEFNNAYKARLTKAGLQVCGTSPNGRLVEMIEIVDHPWFIGCQFHPEFQSKPDYPHPLFKGFIQAAVKYHQKKTS